MIKISSIDFGREPEHYQGLALAEPILVTREGQDSVVVISAEEFRRLKRRDREVIGIEDFTAAEIEAVRTAQPSPEADAFNHELDANA